MHARRSGAQSRKEFDGQRSPRKLTVPLVIGAAVLAVLALGVSMMLRAEARTNKVALSSTAKPVTVMAAKAAMYRPSRMYVGTLEPWVEASIGPQLVSAYVDTVLVRPGAAVKRGEILATLDCRTASAGQRAVASQARAIDAQQKALADEAARTNTLLDGGFVSPNEAEQKAAQSAAQLAQLEATRATLATTVLAVSDCVLRAPFDGEIAQRLMDPGAFARPGSSIVTEVDRTVVRMTADAPEIDFGVVAPGAKVRVHLYAIDEDVVGVVSRRAPSADPHTRTVHFEIDIPDPNRQIPVGTTGEVHIDVGVPKPASEIPLYAATLRGAKASVFVVNGDVANKKTFPVEGESEGQLYLGTSLAPGTLVVTEGRGLLEEGDHVVATEEHSTEPAASAEVDAMAKGPRP